MPDPTTRPPQVAVCGPRECTDRERADAREVGRLLAQAGATVLCGGGTGVMAAAAEGARAADGLVIGIRPGASADDADPNLSAVVVTNLGEARNAVIVWSADAVIVVGGSWGTLSELALAKRRGGVPVVSLGGWQIIGPDPADAVPSVDTAADAVAVALGGR